MTDKPIDVPSETVSEPPKQALTVRDAVTALEPAQAATKPQVTAAQAKIEAVANLTMRAYERASELALTPQEIERLQADFPDEAFKPGAAGKEALIYIEHAFLRDRLNQVFGPGQWAVIPRNRWAEDFSFENKYRKIVEASRVYVEAMLLVRGCFVAEAVGDMVYYKNNEGQNYGDAVEGAKTAALRRCCKELGVGLQAWKRDWCDGWWARKRAGNQPPSRPAQQASTKTPPPPPNAPTGQSEAKETFLPQVEVKLVTEKQGTKQSGQPWHAWFVTMDDGFANLEAGTFSATLGKLALELADTHESAKATIKPGRKVGTFELVSLERFETPPLAPTAPTAPAAPEDDLPYDEPATSTPPTP